jgi:hypothetical protein
MMDATTMTPGQLAHEKMCWFYAVDAQGFDGTFADWLALPADEREEYELGAQGIPTG